MHVPDGLVSGSLNIATGVVSAAAVGASAYKVSREVRERPQRVPMLATTGAFVFAAQMLNFPIGGGTSGHFLGAAVVAALLGPWSACLVMSLVLVVQCLAFGDGGLTALGTNILNMGIVGTLSAWVLMRAIRPMLGASRRGLLVSVGIASWASVVLASAACSLELAWSGTSPFLVVFPAMVGTHALIGIGEALITAAVLSAVLAARRDGIPPWARVDTHGGLPHEPSVSQPTAAAGWESGRSARKRSALRGAWALAVGGLVVALALGAFVSPFASGSPDGLEKIAQDKGFSGAAEGPPAWKASPLADYAVPGVQSEGLSTGLAGLLGTAGVFALGFGVIKLVSGRRDRAEGE